MGEGGVTDCGKAPELRGGSAPKEIPLLDSITWVARATTKRLIARWILGK